MKQFNYRIYEKVFQEEPYTKEEFDLDIKQIVKLACHLTIADFEKSKHNIRRFLKYKCSFKNVSNEKIKFATKVLQNRHTTFREIEEILYGV